MAQHGGAPLLLRQLPNGRGGESSHTTPDESFSDGSNLCRDCYLRLDRRIDVYVRARHADGHEQRVTRRRVHALEIRLLFPPPADRIDTDRIALGQISRCSAPQIGMHRPDIARGAQQPVIAAATACGRALFLFPGRLIDPRPELGQRLGRRFDAEA
jgi:hypothetical protein